MAETGRDDWGHIDADQREKLKQTALAVIKALRVPTPVMCQAGHELLETERGHVVGASDAHDAWQVMIDAAVGAHAAGKA
ncbi:MAG: hypothetical protein DI555_00855 [Novosphingobium pentaromativorans]|uniref:Uncharacterized protein n=2 Tax=Novosphingobium TaxID=165696 RepID=A0A2W5NV87_9SPHN|nr:MAG: hypothetical protein DI555_00855 [Novosphingobium pentaromativorans]